MTARANSSGGRKATTPRQLLAVLASAVAALAGSVSRAPADSLDNEVAQFAALDKVTARISKLEVPLNQTVEFGSLTLTPRACHARPATEQPKTTVFVEVDERELDGQQKRIFTGWMFAESPGLNAVEHPVFDVWLTGCKQPAGAVARAAAKGEANAGPEAGEAASGEATTRRRVRR